MAKSETANNVDRSDPLVFALGSAASAVLKAMSMLTGEDADPAVARLLTTYAVGSFINAGGLDLTQAQADIITGMLAEMVDEGGLSGAAQ